MIALPRLSDQIAVFGLEVYVDGAECQAVDLPVSALPPERSTSTLTPAPIGTQQNQGFTDMKKTRTTTFISAGFKMTQ